MSCNDLTLHLLSLRSHLWTPRTFRLSTSRDVSSVVPVPGASGSSFTRRPSLVYDQEGGLQTSENRSFVDTSRKTCVGLGHRGGGPVTSWKELVSRSARVRRHSGPSTGLVQEEKYLFGSLPHDLQSVPPGAKARFPSSVTLSKNSVCLVVYIYIGENFFLT